MRKQIIEKLNSKNGASISFALFAFIFATIVSLVIVAAALTNVIKVRQERENEQAYLVAQSLANLISEQIVSSDNEVVAENEENKYTDRYVRIVEVTDGEGTKINVTSPEGDSDKVIAEPFKSAIEEICKSRYSNIQTKSQSQALPDDKLLKTTEQTLQVQASNVGRLSDDVADKISHTKITCYMPKTDVVSNGGVVTTDVSDYYDMEVLIEVPAYGSKTYSCRMRFEAVQKGSGNATYVYWPTATLIKGKSGE